VAIALSTAACSIDQSANNGNPAPLADFHGMFQGDQISNDGRRVNIAFDVQQKDGELSGTYRCAPGNANCRNQITKGWVMGDVKGRSLRVSLQDTSWCMYSLGTFYVNEGEGDYTCYLGGTIADQGAFSIKRREPK
jgi:hypothetical protein